ncbi:MAG: hypothetical protein KDE03_17980 [Rhodobacteraceae bacterium]|nr:hypothetical protein [Paracoccaceae bacterium]
MAVDGEKSWEVGFFNASMEAVSLGISEEYRRLTRWSGARNLGLSLRMHELDMKKSLRPLRKRGVASHVFSLLFRRESVPDMRLFQSRNFADITIFESAENLARNRDLFSLSSVCKFVDCTFYHFKHQDFGKEGVESTIRVLGPRHAVRNIVVTVEENENGRATPYFHQTGTPYPWEDTKNYEFRSIASRLNNEIMRSYINRIRPGLAAIIDNPDFFRGVEFSRSLLAKSLPQSRADTG